MVKWILGLLILAGLVTATVGCRAEGEIETSAAPVHPANVS